MDERIAEDSTRREADQRAGGDGTHLTDVSELLAAGIASEVKTTRHVDLHDSDVVERLCLVSIT